MASTASPNVGVQRSQSSRKGPSHTSQSSTLPSRSQSTTTRPTSSTKTQSHSYSRPNPSQQPPPLSGNYSAAHRDPDGAATRPSGSRRSSSQDRTNHPPQQSSPSRTESTRSQRSAPKSSQSRYAESGTTSTATTAVNGASPHVRSSLDYAQPPVSKGRRTTITGQTGTWNLGKTIGAGSMGKVKLAKQIETGQQVAVKIVPRQSSPDDGHHHSSKDKERQDHSKEIRTAREAAIVSLLDHPYICGMRDVVRTHFHWYMLFEYVNGGQMLDYIISHGKLKEKPARKFGRQIASALDYCHRNSIVHRDLKIENILISKTGDIKIIDFGLSNLFSPRSHLKTFCGSLYFAAPELLQARPYNGPEVDIWSFGIVLYVLVCGKVPFDDQSMPQLHAKIKKGLVDYPQWLSAECKNLISRMLVTDPRQRATIHEVMNHPWITKGFNAPPENYLPHREPLQLPLDPEVIQGMTGFDFGPADVITTQLTKVLESEEYQAALRSAKEQQLQASTAEKKRSFPGFDFYKRRNSTSKDNLNNPSCEAVHFGSDPVNAFSPLISIYYLVREKQDRSRHEANPGATKMPRSPGEPPLNVPDLPAPEAAHTNTSAYEYPGESATGGRTRARSRTHGEDEAADALANAKPVNAAHNGPNADLPSTIDQQVPKKESTAAGLLRRFSTRRHKEGDRTRERSSAQQPPVVSVQPPSDTAAAAAIPRKSFSIRKTRDRTREGYSAGNLHAGRSQPAHDELLTPPGSADVRGSKSLGRSASVNSAEYRRRQPRGVSEGPPARQLHDPPLTSGSDRSSISGQPVRSPTSAYRDPEKSTSGAKPGTVRTMSLGHARRESIQARRAMREQQPKESNVPEETDRELAEESRRTHGAENVKPVFLKGLFSVSTTSTKPVPAIRADIIRVLNQIGLEYSEIRGGFTCKHTPSIDLNQVVDDAPMSPDMAAQTPAHKRKISFGGFMGGGGDREDFRHREKQSQTTKGNRNGPIDTSQTNSDLSEESVGKAGGHTSSGGRGAARATGETSTHVQSELGGSMILQFEILIVKVSILSLHGIQFKRLAGGTWQYKNMADKILKELRL